VKIGPVDAEIYSVDLKKGEISVSKIYSLVGKFAERVKKFGYILPICPVTPMDGFPPNFA